MTKHPLPIALAALVLAASTAAAAGAPPILVELFTSEGCSSCPPADELLGRLAGQDDVLPLAFHVTYWDQLGWQDSFGDRSYVVRQREYASRLGTGTIYTPEMVVDGRTDVVGSDGPAAVAAIRSARERGGAASVGFHGDRAELPTTRLDRPVAIWLAAYDGHQRVAVARGENGGRTLDHYNVVRELDQLGSWDGQARSVTLPLDRLRGEHRTGMALVAQDLQTGRIVALGRLAL